MCTAIQAKRDHVLTAINIKYVGAVIWKKLIESNYWGHNGSGAWHLCDTDYLFELNSCE